MDQDQADEAWGLAGAAGATVVRVMDGEDSYVGLVIAQLLLRRGPMREVVLVRRVHIGGNPLTRGMAWVVEARVRRRTF